MSREVAITAISHLSLKVDGDHLKYDPVKAYGKRWIEEVLKQNPDRSVEGRLIICCSYDAAGWIVRAVKEGQARDEEIYITDEDDIYAPPGRLLQVLLWYWDQWHEEDPRWAWSKQAIVEFFNLYRWAIIYIEVS